MVCASCRWTKRKSEIFPVPVAVPTTYSPIKQLIACLLSYSIEFRNKPGKLLPPFSVTALIEQWGEFYFFNQTHLSTESLIRINNCLDEEMNFRFPFLKVTIHLEEKQCYDLI